MLRKANDLFPEPTEKPEQAATLGGVQGAVPGAPGDLQQWQRGKLNSRALTSLLETPEVSISMDGRGRVFDNILAGRARRYT